MHQSHKQTECYSHTGTRTASEYKKKINCEGRVFVHKEESTCIDTGGKQQAVMCCRYLKPLEAKEAYRETLHNGSASLQQNMMSHLPFAAATMTSDKLTGPRGVKIISLVGGSGSLFALVSFRSEQSSITPTSSRHLALQCAKNP